VDLVILNDRPPSNSEDMQRQIQAIAAACASGRPESLPGSGRAFFLRADSLGAADRDLLYCAARAIFVASRGALTDQLTSLEGPDGLPRPRAPAPSPAMPDGDPAMPELAFFNGQGGFSADGREYVTGVDKDRWTPAPWCNVIANADFGLMASTEGNCTTWSLNSRENQLTPWSNDPVGNAPAEVIYLRDMDTGALWSATPLPIRDRARYLVRHGFGYTRCDHEAQGVAVELTQFVALDGPVKIARLRITNRSGRTRNLSITHYLDWVLGRERSRSAEFIVTSIDPATGALLARNPWNASFATRVAFMDLCGRQQSWTADRREFLGRHGSLAEPAALLHGSALSSRVGAGLDPCGALQTQERIGPGDSVQLVFLLGQGASQDEAAALVTRFRAENPNGILEKVSAFWTETLDAVQVKTPDRALDFMVNGWLLYQVLACRLWARTGFYQASGAYGFRDQLQDVMALCVARPKLAREHILRAAARQFQAGDVQHWWLPSGQGIQTRISDNRIWLPYVTTQYLSVTGDPAVLDEQVPFLEGGPLPPDQHELFASPRAVGSASLFEHCALALDYSLQTGERGLPLIGTGDWNDGMNRVGAAGRGESVWLGWFLYTALLAFAPVAEARGESARGLAWRNHARALLQAIEGEGWDGEWYRRGYFDDGTPLGSANSDECRIDSIAQSWAVLSGAGERSRAVRAMSAVDAQLVDRGGDGLVRLFTPPFDHTPQDPGYIKAYPPGIRENGGQYTHAAAWAAWAFAALGDGDAAGRLFSLLNPISHASTAAAVDRYKVEPYIVCADVYSAPLHVGRGGWTWYTGSAGWMYRTAVEAILGFTVHAGALQLEPCIPRHWPGFEITHRFGSSTYRIQVANPSGVNRGVREILVDGVPGLSGDSAIRLVDDGRAHEVRVILGSE
jgi:cyclic beta-1,2-glucan synthetase